MFIMNKIKNIEAQIGENINNIKPRPKFTGSYKKECTVYSHGLEGNESIHPNVSISFCNLL